MKTANTNIFESPSQVLKGIQPENIKLQWDRILIRDIPDPDKIGSIWIPETAAERGVGKKGLLRMGIVVAVGPGDPWASEKVITARAGDVMGGNQVVRKALGECEICAGGGQIKTYKGTPESIGLVVPARWSTQDVPVETCPECKGDGIRRWQMYCKPGDKIIYDVRREAEFWIEGVRHVILHEEQSVYAILEQAA